MATQNQPFNAPTVAGMDIDFDTTRHVSCHPGRLLYSAKLDRDVLSCYYRALLFCYPEELVNRTYLDVYSNGVLANVPKGCCCCLSTDDGRFVHYDHSMFTSPPVAGGCCNPAPHPCMHCFNLCGETLVFRSGMFGMPIGCPVGLFHGWEMCWIFCPVDVLCGLKAGEGDKLQSVLKVALDNFKSGKREVVAPAGISLSKV